MQPKESNFIINFKAKADEKVERYSMLVYPKTLSGLTDIILSASRHYIINEHFSRVSVEVWKWQRKRASYMFRGVINADEIDTIFIK